MGIDVGTTNTKIALVAIGAAGVRVLAVASAPTPQPPALAGVLHNLLRRVLAGHPAPQAVGIASMAETGVPLDATDTPAGEWVRWDGHRRGFDADGLVRRLGGAELTAGTGVRPSAKVPLLTWAWLREQRPDQWSAMARWAGAADLVCLLLTGRLGTDHTLAGRTMAYRLPAAGGAVPDGFDADLLGEVGLRPNQLPSVVPPGEIAAPVSAPGFVAAGLRPGTPVVVAGHDHAVGAFAAGARQAGDVVDSVGTAEAVMSVVPTTPSPAAAAAAGMSVVVTVDGVHRAILAGAPTAGALVRWWLAHEAPDASADELFAEVLALDDAPSGLLVLPYLHGRQAPAPDPAAQLRVIGRRSEHTRGQLARAMLEGLCLHARWMLQAQAELAGSAGPPGPVTVLGAALLANPAWLRIKALVTPRSVRVVGEAEAVAAGAALLAATRAGLTAPAEAVLEHVVASTAPSGEYDDAFAAFVAAATSPAAHTDRAAARGDTSSSPAAGS